MNIFEQITIRVRNAPRMSGVTPAYFFKTGAGQYAERDEFLGVAVPTLRMIAKDFIFLELGHVQLLLQSKINEERLLALIILTQQYKKADLPTKETIYQTYLDNLSQVNNWNLVDSSAHLIIGAHLWDKDRCLLLELAASESLWSRRIAIVSTWYFIRKNDLQWTFKLAKMLLNDTHDLIHKAVGWMLREAGKRNQHELIKLLDQHAQAMPRTMLRYAIEKFDVERRKHYMRT